MKKKWLIGPLNQWRPKDGAESAIENNRLEAIVL